MAAVLRGMQAAVTALMVDLVADMAAMVIKSALAADKVLVPAPWPAMLGQRGADPAGGAPRVSAVSRRRREAV